METKEQKKLKQKLKAVLERILNLETDTDSLYEYLYDLEDWEINLKEEA